jgi:hypothetical protein
VRCTNNRIGCFTALALTLATSGAVSEASNFLRRGAKPTAASHLRHLIQSTIMVHLIA